MASTRRRLKGKTGEYQLLVPLTQSGISSVHLARRVDATGWDRFVIFRELLPHLIQDDKAVEQFLQEARIAVRFVHPNLVRVLEAGKSKAGIFSVVEYLAGDGLGCLLSRGDLAPGLTAGLIAQAAEGLAFAHTLTTKKGEPLNVVHRNINSRNLVVEPDGRAKLINFDIGRPLDRPHPTRLTAYLSPEQCVGKPTGPASDVFSLGVVLWEALAGRHLFKRADDLDTRRAVMACDVPPLASVRADLPDLLEKIALRALAKDPADRFPTAAEMAAALQQAGDMADLDASQESVAAHLSAVLGERLAAKRKALEQLEASSEAEVDKRVLLPDARVELPLAEVTPGGGVDAPAPSLPPRPGEDPFAVPPPVDTELGLPDAPAGPGETEEPVTMPNLAPKFSAPAERTPPPLPRHPPSQAEPAASAAEEQIAEAAAPAADEPTAAESEPQTPVEPAAAPVPTPAFQAGPPIPDDTEVSSEIEPLDASAPALDDMGAVREVEQEPPPEAEPEPEAEDEDEPEVEQPPFEPSLRVRRSFEQFLVPGAIAGGVLLLLLIVILAWPSDDDEDQPEVPAAGDTAAADQPAEQDLDLPPPKSPADDLRFGRLEIRTDPKGCQASLAGLALDGTTPLPNVIVPAGAELEVKVVCADHQPESQQVTAREGEVVPVEFYPTPLVKPGKPRFGRLQLTTGRPVTVFLGKKRLGKTPLVGKRLPAGTHTLRLVRKSDGIDVTIHVQIPAGDVAVVERRL